MSRYVSAGREVLSWEGVLPWALWREGGLPRQWWLEFRFLHAVTLWYVTYITRNRDVLEALVDYRRAAIEYVRVLQRRHREIEAGQRASEAVDAQQAAT